MESDRWFYKWHWLLLNQRQLENYSNTPQLFQVNTKLASKILRRGSNYLHEPKTSFQSNRPPMLSSGSVVELVEALTEVMQCWP